MSLPGNGIFVVRGEMSAVVTAMRRGARWSAHSHQDDEGLIRGFQELKDTLNKSDDLRLVQSDVYLDPFLEVIRSEETTGHVTSLALSAVNKFLSYGLIDPTHSGVPTTVHKIADAVTHAKFVGTDSSSDGVVLMRILQVLRTLTLAPEGAMLTNESLCEIMLSCFRICFETRLNELLRRTAEHYLKDMVQLVFMRLPQFSEDIMRTAFKQFKMRPGAIEQTRTKRRKSFRMMKKEEKEDVVDVTATAINTTTTTITTTTTNNNNNNFKKGGQDGEDDKSKEEASSANIVDMQGSISQGAVTPSELPPQSLVPPPSDALPMDEDKSPKDEQNSELLLEESKESDDLKKELDDSTTSVGESVEEQQQLLQQSQQLNEEYVNQRGIRFTPQIQEDLVLIPYGLACVRELFRFLISLCNPLDKGNTDVMIQLGLTLLTVAFEVGADSIGKYQALLTLVKDDLCRNLFSLLSSERSVFAADLQVCFLMFESLRTHLKFQLEMYLTRLKEIIQTDNPKVTYDHKELALDNVLQMWKIPGLVTELYLNYDCNMYCSNLYEDLTELLAKNVLSASTGIYHTHMLSLDALLTVIETIERHCGEDDKHLSQHDNQQCDKEQNCDDKIAIESIIGAKGSRQKLSDNVPAQADLMACKDLKRWLPTGTDHFNHKPKKGIQFLQEHGVLKPQLDPYEVAMFLKENSALDKKMIGEYISSRSNLHILDAFVKTFDFTDMRIDEALRHYLETFRLPGEAPTISLLLEHFAEHWHKSNGEPFADVDSAFTLAYAVIMLNVDQHNQNAKKQTTPMSPSGFKKNLKGVNGGVNDFDQDMLDEIYNAIKNDEIVMPAEQTGLVRENYLWKVLLRKGNSKDGHYFHVNNGQFDAQLFQLMYGPSVAALSFVFDKSREQALYVKAVEGFRRCAAISSHFSLTTNLDTLLLTICKFTTFTTASASATQQRTNNAALNFGANPKARLALKTATDLCHQHGDNIRAGWKHMFELVLALYAHNLLPKIYVEAEDFIQASGKISLVYEEVESLQKQDTGLFSSLYSYMLSSENLSKVPTPEEQQLIDLAKDTIRECSFEHLITDSKFLHDDALLEVVKALVELSRGPDVQKSLGYNYNENVAVFFLELLVKVVIQNRDRVMTIWHLVRDHIYMLVMNASVFDYQFLLERAVIGLLRIAIRLMRNEDMSPVVLQSLQMLLMLKSSTLSRIARQISFGLYELLKTSAQNIHTKNDWTIVFTLLECVGAGAQPPRPMVEDGGGGGQQGTKSDGETGAPNSDEEVSSDRGYTSDSELVKSSPRHAASRHSPPLPGGASSPAGSPGTAGGWILVGSEGEIQPVVGRTVPPGQYALTLDRHPATLDPSSMIKCCESLAFLVRDVAHITPYNFDDCVHCIRTFVEASLHSGSRNASTATTTTARGRRSGRRKTSNRSRRTAPVKSPVAIATGGGSQAAAIASSPDEDSNDDYDDDSLPSGYHQISIQLLDLMHTLHTRTAQIFKWWAEEGGTVAMETSLWTQGWCPLLQGIARLCCDVRRDVRMSAITYLQRALLVHDLQTLSGPEWEACFHRVLFPLLAYLLNSIDARDPTAMEETRMRAATVLSKVFLHHLTPLLSLPTFANLWLIILDFIDRYMHADRSDLLYEAIPESLKNMLLVMDSAGVFDGPDGNKGELWTATWVRINKFLPGMKDELFKEMSRESRERIVEETGGAGAVQKHNVENATRSSIILQPPQQQPQVSSHLFAHLGQMVSTPIGSSPATMQPTLQPGMPYLFAKNNNQPNNNGGSHTFPVLYSTPVITTTAPTEVQPVSLYTEYMGNPYNVPGGESSNQSEEEIKKATPPALPPSDFNDNDDNNSLPPSEYNNSPNNNHSNVVNDDIVQLPPPPPPPPVPPPPQANFFQSSNYFTDSGSEFLFGNEHQQQQQQRGSNNTTIPVACATEIKTTDV